MRLDTLQRVLKLRKRLDGLRYAPRLDQLAKEFNVTPRTIRRDLESLEAAGERLPMWRFFRDAF